MFLAQKPILPSSIGEIDINSISPCNETYTNDDCEALIGPGGVCSNNQCYCDRSRSFVRNSRCGKLEKKIFFLIFKISLKYSLELYTTFVFPGTHENYLYACNTNNDCGTNGDNNGTICDFGGIDANYKLCQCNKGYFYNANSGKCGMRKKAFSERWFFLNVLFRKISM